MRAAIFQEPKRVEIGDRPDPSLREPTDAIVRVVLACVCGSDLWSYRGDSPFDPGPVGHEFIGVVEDVGTEVTAVCAHVQPAMDERRAIKSLVRVSSL